jgi:hypothetical protein
MVGHAIMMEIMVMKAVYATGQENRTADKERRPIEPRVPPRVRFGVRIQVDRLWRQRVDLLRQSRRIQRDLPVSIRLLARLPGGLSRLSFNRDLRGELAAILKGRLCWDKCSVRRAWWNLPGTPRQDQHHCDSQKGMRTSISRTGGDSVVHLQGDTAYSRSRSDAMESNWLAVPTATSRSKPEPFTRSKPGRRESRRR